MGYEGGGGGASPYAEDELGEGVNESTREYYPVCSMRSVLSLQYVRL